MIQNEGEKCRLNRTIKNYDCSVSHAEAARAARCRGYYCVDVDSKRLLVVVAIVVIVVIVLLVCSSTNINTAVSEWCI